MQLFDVRARGHPLLAFVPASKFTLVSGEDALTDYTFNKHAIHHVFCGTCGVRAFAKGELGGNPMRAINARCLEGVDLDALPVKKVDGKSF